MTHFQTATTTTSAVFELMAPSPHSLERTELLETSVMGARFVAFHFVGLSTGSSFRCIRLRHHSLPYTLPTSSVSSTTGYFCQAVHPPWTLPRCGLHFIVGGPRSRSVNRPLASPRIRREYHLAAPSHTHTRTSIRIQQSHRTNYIRQWDDIDSRWH